MVVGADAARPRLGSNPARATTRVALAAFSRWADFVSAPAGFLPAMVAGADAARPRLGSNPARATTRVALAAFSRWADFVSALAGFLPAMVDGADAARPRLGSNPARATTRVALAAFSRWADFVSALAGFLPAMVVGAPACERTPERGGRSTPARPIWASLSSEARRRCAVVHDVDTAAVPGLLRARRGPVRAATFPPSESGRLSAVRNRRSHPCARLAPVAPSPCNASASHP
jgi:hypothetical protein